MQNPLGLLVLGGGLMLALRIIHDRGQLKQLTLELEQSNQHLSAENRRLLDFSAIAAHDLKSPVVRISSLVGFLREDIQETGLTLPETIAEEIDFIDEAAKAMRLLIDDLAEYSLSQNRTYEDAVFDPVPRLRGIVQGMQLPQGFEVAIEEELPWLNVPPAAFDTVIRNLISNAVKHHDMPSGRVRISAHVADNFATIEITDDGPGVPDRFIERIFRPLERLSPDGSEGSGLGLSFVCGLVKAWKGSVHAYPAGKRGLTVAISAPVGDNGEAAVPQAGAKQKAQDFGSDVQHA